MILPAASYEYATIQRISGDGPPQPATDLLAAEEPLEIRLGYEAADGQRQHRTLAITMRTPGHDEELAAGFLLTEGIIHQKSALLGIRPCSDVQKPEEAGNVVRAELAAHVQLDFPALTRHFYTSSSCGVCGKTSIAAVQTTSCPVLPTHLHVAAATIHQLPARLRAAQSGFEQTGGQHAAALFNATGELLSLREDVGRHNALDKLIGAALLADELPLHQHILLVSGRASFELVQKASAAGIGILAAVGAPSSLAVQAAEKFGLTLLGFVRDNRYNVYCHGGRILSPAPLQ